MNDDPFDLTTEIRRAVEGEARNPGASVPSTTGASRSGSFRTGDGAQSVGGLRAVEFPERGATGPAFQGGANDFGWQPQHRMEVGAHVEAMVRRAADGEAFLVDPTKAPVWFIDTAGLETVTILFATRDQWREGRLAEDAPADRQDGSFAMHCTVWVNRQSKCRVDWPGVWWPDSVLDYLDHDNPAQGSALAGPYADEPGVSCYTFMLLPEVGVSPMGNVVGMRWRAPGPHTDNWVDPPEETP